MTRFRFWEPLATLALHGAALCNTLTFAHAVGNPAIRMADGVEYMSGGNDAAEKMFLQMVSRRWAVGLQFAVNRSR